MTLIELRNAGHRYARKPYWHPYCGLEMPPKIGEYFGPWCKLIDWTDKEFRESGKIIPIPFHHADDGESDWEPMDSIPELPEYTGHGGKSQ